MLIASPSNTSSLCKGRRYYLLIAVSIVVGALLALPLFIGSASTPTTLINQVAVKDKFDISTVTPHQNLQFLNFNFLAPLLPPTPQGGPVTVETYASDCTTPKNEYNVQDTDLTVCAKFTNALPGWRVIWSNARAIAVQTTIITSANGTATFTLNA